jgi:hypothetical protein
MPAIVAPDASRCAPGSVPVETCVSSRRSIGVDQVIDQPI